MHQEDDTDNLNKYHQDTIHLSGVCHIEEYTEYVDRQQRQDYRADRFDDDFFKIVGYIFQCVGIQVCQSQSECEGEDKCCHYIH